MSSSCRDTTKAKVLLVDDEPANLVALKACLEGLDTELVEAHSGEDALRLLRENEFAVMLLDAQMQGLDGFETANRIREREEPRRTPIIFQTAHDTDRATIERAYELGAVDFLVKPLMPVALRAKVNGFVELFQYRQQVERRAEQSRETERRELEQKLAKESSRLQQQQEWLSVTLGSIGDAVIATDPDGRVTFLNAVAESLTGWQTKEAVGRPLTEVFHIINEATRRPVENPVARAIATGGIVGLANHTVLIAKDGVERAIDDSAAPIKDAQGRILGVVMVFRDVTERRRAETVAWFLASIVESSDDAIIGKDVNGIITSWNHAAERLFGYPAAEAVGRPVAMLAPPDRADEMPLILERIRRGERVGHLDTMRRTQDGRIVPISLTVSPIRDQDGKIIGASKIARDISKRKLAEEAVRAATQNLQIVTESMAAPVTRCSRDLTYQWVNKPYADWIGRAAEEIVGRPIVEIVGSEAFTQLQPYFEKVLQGEVVRYEQQVSYQTIGPRWITSIYMPTLDAAGRVEGWVAVVLDMTGRKKMEDALAESEQRLAGELAAISRLHDLSTRLLAADDLSKALDDVLDNAIAAGGADFGTIQLYNTQLGALEIVAQRGFEQAFLDHFRAVRVEDGTGCGQALQNGDRAIIEDVNLDPAYEPHRKVAAAAGYRAVQSTPLKSRAGTILGILSTHFRSPHRPSERDERLLDLYARHAGDLIQRVRFEQALQEADRRKDEFLAMLAHELRNPLASISGAVRLARESGDAEDAAWSHAVIERQLRNLSRIIDDLLDVARITQGKIRLATQALELLPTITAAVEAVQPLVEERNHRLEVSWPGEALWVRGDPTRIDQILVNLLSNAAKYTPNGGRIWLSAEKSGEEIIIKVRDNGVGIAPETIPKLFELFSQGERSLARSEGGLGIGLTLAKRLTELHGGRVWVASEGIGKGSEFSVALPAAAAPREMGAEADSEPKQAPSRRILIVDDNVDTARSIGRLLRLHGHTVSLAHDAPEALEAAHAHRPECILLDIGLPGIDGLELAKTLHRQPCCRDAAFIAVTGYGDEEMRARVREAGFDHHLVKPIDFDVLTALVARRAL
jgi:PAS domain S-box-containing protein